MGASNTISEQKNLNKEFADYVDEQTKRMNAHVEDAKKDIAEDVKKHYSTYTDRVQLLQGSYSHLTTVSEWGLDNVNKMITSIKDSLFGIKAPPQGTTKDAVSEATTKSIAALSAFDLLIASAAFEVIQGILTALGSSTKTEVTKLEKNKKVAPGVNLFIAVLDSSYQRSTFLDNQLIVQNMYVFEVHYSTQEGLIDAKRSTLQTYMDEKEIWIGQIGKIGEAVEKLTPGDDLDKYQLQINQYDKILDTFNDKLQKLDAEIVKLAKLAEKHAMLAARVPSHGLAVRHLQQKCANLLDVYGNHGKCWLVANGEDGNKYWAFVRKYSDAFEKSFRIQIAQRTGHPARGVHREYSEPEGGIEIVFQ